jgi:tRNA-2-methylthio-N6-dimethylallyladenosine synthase
MLVQLQGGNNRVTGLGDRNTDETFDTEVTARGDAHRGYITIIEGCDKFCAYCVVPFTRGKERSRTSQSVVDEARRMADMGYTSIQLLGQNVNSYRDPAGKKSFAELLIAVSEVPGIRRVWFTTSHPRDFTKDIVDAIEAYPGLCNHVHLPVQSGSTKVLNAMQRLYTREQYLERISWMKASKRDISITTDIIVGFPGETREEFEETISLVHEVRYDGAFTFKYSPRPNTAALSLPDVIAEEEKSLRLSILMDRIREIQIENHKRHLGQIHEVMVEGRNEVRKQWHGRTPQNKVVNFTSPSDIKLESGTYANIRVTQTTPNSLVGEYIETTCVPELRSVGEIPGAGNLVQIAQAMVAPVTSGV